VLSPGVLIKGANLVIPKGVEHELHLYLVAKWCFHQVSLASMKKSAKDLLLSALFMVS
jgi:hypothetical protein